MIFKRPTVCYVQDSSTGTSGDTTRDARREEMMRLIMQKPDKPGIEAIKETPREKVHTIRKDTILLDSPKTQINTLISRLKGKNTGLKLNKKENTTIDISNEKITISTEVTVEQTGNMPGECTLTFFRPRPGQKKILKISFNFAPRSKPIYSIPGSEKSEFEICFDDFKNKPETKINSTIDEILGIIKDYLNGTLIFKLQAEIDRYIRGRVYELKYEK